MFWNVQNYIYECILCLLLFCRSCVVRDYRTFSAQRPSHRKLQFFEFNQPNASRGGLSGPEGILNLYHAIYTLTHTQISNLA